MKQNWLIYLDSNNSKRRGSSGTIRYLFVFSISIIIIIIIIIITIIIINIIRLHPKFTYGYSSHRK